MTPSPVVIEITAYVDIACPWCAVGNLSLLKAIDAVRDLATVKVTHEPYFLHPEIPREGIAKSPFELFNKRLQSSASNVGLTFSFSGFVSNTGDALRLIKYTRSQPETQHLLVTNLFRRYFELGENVGNVDVLLAAAQEVGLDRTKVADYLASNDDVLAISEGTRLARADDIHGVPCYVFNQGLYRLVGGQETQVFEQSLRALARRQQQTQSHM